MDGQSGWMDRLTTWGVANLEDEVTLSSAPSSGSGSGVKGASCRLIFFTRSLSFNIRIRRAFAPMTLDPAVSNQARSSRHTASISWRPLIVSTVMPSLTSISLQLLIFLSSIVCPSIHCTYSDSTFMASPHTSVVMKTFSDQRCASHSPNSALI